MFSRLFASRLSRLTTFAQEIGIIMSLKRETKLTAATVALAFALPVFAQQAAAPAAPPRPPAPPRAKAVALTPAVELAQAAVAACAANGYKVSVLVTDSAGETIVLLSGDGVGLRTQSVAKNKVAAVMKYKISSGEVAAKAKDDPKLAEELKADPNIGGIPFQGGIPLKVNGEFLGAAAASGAPGGEKDEACLQAALVKVQLH